MLDLDGNPEDRFSHEAAHMKNTMISCAVSNVAKICKSKLYEVKIKCHWKCKYKHNIIF